MSIAPEAELEARVGAMLPVIFPHMPVSGFRHQIRFAVRLGRKTYEEDGARSWVAEGRADIILFHEERPLAVIELKREDKPLAENDVRQGQSYAAQFTPRPPLVIVTNGKQTWLRDSATAELVASTTDGLELVQRLFANAAKIAAADMAWAVEILIGPQSGIWANAVRNRTDTLVERMSGGLADERRPFTPILFPRRVTAALTHLLEDGRQAIIVAGPPLSGKSNVLRELAERTRNSGAFAVLLLDGKTPGPGLFQRLANILSAELEWPMSADDVRQWLRRMSNSMKKPALVLAVDGVRPGGIATDIEELAESGFGAGLRIVMTVDSPDAALQSDGGRGETALASLARVLALQPLDDDEFDVARQVLADRRIIFQAGAELSDEYRTPWLMRAVLEQAPPPDDERMATVIPASLGLELVTRARARLSSFHKVQRDYGLLAAEAVGDDSPSTPELALAQANAFVVRADALGVKGEAAAARLAEQGWTAEYRHAGGEDIVTPRVPEFFMSELAREMLNGLERSLATDPEEGAAWLIVQCSRFYLGDLIGAQVLGDLARRRGGFPAGFLESLVADEPTEEILGPSLLAMQLPDGSTQNLRIDDEGRTWFADAAGVAFGDPLDLSPSADPGKIYGSTTAWMILSQFAGLRIEDGDGEDRRLDQRLMLHLGCCRFPLMRGGAVPKGQMTHSLGVHGEILAMDHALAEPLTNAIYRMFMADWASCDWFLREAAATGSVPLLARIHNALAAVRGNVTPGIDDWVEDTLQRVIGPALRASMDAAPGEE